MIRNVHDNNKQANPYTMGDSNLRVGRFYSNKLNTDESGKAGRTDMRGSPGKRFIGGLTSSIWPFSSGQ